LTKEHSSIFVIFLGNSTEKLEVKTMELADKQIATPIRSWISRVEKIQPKRVEKP
jgi:hypothetical protein